MDFYTYKAHCYNVVDGDTADLDLDMGLKVHVKERVRLAGIDTPEIHGVKKDSEEYKKGMLAKEEVERLILNKNIIVQTEKDKTGKYGRYIAHVYFDEQSESLNDYLVKNGFAVAVKY